MPPTTWPPALPGASLGCGTMWGRVPAWRGCAGGASTQGSPLGRWSLRPSPPSCSGRDVRSCVTSAANLGGDADSIAALAGAMAACHAPDSLPAPWVETVAQANSLQNIPEIAAALARLRLQHRATASQGGCRNGDGDWKRDRNPTAAGAGGPGQGI